MFERPDWVNRHWQRGSLPGTPDCTALKAEVAALVASQPLAFWAHKFESADACVTPVLTIDEAQAHPLFAGQASPQAWQAIA